MEEEMDFDNMSETLVHFNFDVSFCRFMGDYLYPCRMSVRLGIDILDEEELQFAITKMKHWLSDHMTNCIAVSSGNVKAFEALLGDTNEPRFINTLMITPGDPTDRLLMHVLQAKLEAIGDGAFMVSMIEVRSDNGEGITMTYFGDADEMLPPMDEWLAGPSWFTIPWWHRNDISLFDTVAPDGADLTVKPLWATNFDYLRETEAPPAIIVRADFEPKVVKTEK